MTENLRYNIFQIMWKEFILGLYSFNYQINHTITWWIIIGKFGGLFKGTVMLDVSSDFAVVNFLSYKSIIRWFIFVLKSLSKISQFFLALHVNA